jgi:hypothetical protein
MRFYSQTKSLFKMTGPLISNDHKFKAPHHMPYRKLQPLPVPERPWLSLSLDHIIKLPGQSLFYINYSYHPHTEFTVNNSSVPAAQEHVINL